MLSLKCHLAGLCFLLTLPGAGHAAQYEAAHDSEFSALVQKGAFYDPDALPITPKAYARVNAAAVRIGGNTEACGAVLLSTDGFVATATHCMKECLTPAWDYTPAIRMNWVTSASEAYGGMQIQEQTPQRLACPVAFLDDLYIWEYDLTSPKVVWMGKGTFHDDEKKLAALAPDVFNQLKDMPDDVTILKYEFLGKPQPLPCLRSVTERPKPGAAVWTLGFPRLPNDYVHDGYHKFVSVGRVRPSIAEDPILQTYAAQIPVNLVTQFWNYQLALWDKPSLLETTLRSYRGNSGGMIVDQNGDLAAILFSEIKSDTFYTGTTVIGVSLPYIKAQVTQALGPTQAARVFNCPTRVEASNLSPAG